MSLLDDPVFRRHEQILVFIEIADCDHRRDLFVRFELKKIDDRCTPGCASRFRDFEGLQAVHLALVREEEQIVMGGRREQMLDKVVLSRRKRGDSLAASSLRTVGIGGDPFDIADMSHRDHDIVFLDQVFDEQLVRIGFKGRSALIGILVLDLQQLFLDDAQKQTFVREDFAQLLDQLHQLRVFLFDLVAFESGQALQTHVEYRLSLNFRQSEAVHQLDLRFLAVLCGADQRDDLVDMVQRDAQTFQDMSSGFRLLQIEAGTSRDDFLLILDVFLEDLTQIQDHRLALAVFVPHKREHDHTEGFLQLGMLVQLIQDNRIVGILLQVDDDADARFKTRFVSEVGDAFDALFSDEIRDLFDELGLVYHVGELGDDDLLAALFRRLDIHLRADLDP